VLAKVIKLKHTGSSRGFRPVMEYVMRASEEEARKVASGERFEAGHLNMESYWDARTDLTNEEERRGFARDLALQCESLEAACRARPASRFKGNPVYHVAINWMEGEHPSREQAERACQHVMASLGCADHQAAWAIHHDTDNDHVHLVVNRVHPERLTVWSPPFRKDYFILDKCMRELEIEFGHGRANGPFITLDTEQGPEIVRMSRAERRARGLLKESTPGAPRLTDAATRAEKGLGAGLSFQSWVADAPARDLKAVLERTGAGRSPGATWQDVHAALARHGVRIETKGSGMVVTARLGDGRVLAAKASQLGRFASKAELEKRIGPFTPPDPARALAPPERERSYEAALERSLVDVDRDQPHGAGERKDRDPNRRAGQRAARAEEREALRATYKGEQAGARVRRRNARAALTARHRTERADLRKLIREDRQAARSQARKDRIDLRLALALHAKRAAERTEALQKRQATERAALRALPPAEAWRQWLIERAAAGDRAAEAALRGIRYRERRKVKRDAIEGADEGALTPRLTVAALTADLDARRHLITYRGTDGAAKFVDFGQRIEMRDRTADSLEAALRIAAEKYGGRVSIQGSGEFRARAARLATRIGVRVSDEDLRSIVTDERERIEQEWRQPGISGAARQQGAEPRSTDNQDAERVDEDGRDRDR
jgi:hypothetical protein